MSEGELRCSSCDRLLAELATPPYRVTCDRCHAVTARSAALERLTRRLASSRAVLAELEARRP